MTNRLRLVAAVLVTSLTAAATGHAQPGAPEPVIPAPPAAPWPAWSPELVYHQQSKSTGAAFALEFFVPGAGSVYGDHAAGAAVTWGLMGVGALALMMAFAMGHHDETPNPVVVPMAIGGFALMGGGRVYGLVDAVQSTDRFNAGLRGRLAGF